MKPESHRKSNNGYPSDWHLVQVYIPRETWVALKQRNIKTGQSIAAQLRQAIDAQLQHQNDE